MIRGRDHAFVLEVERLERLHGVEEQVLRLHVLAAAECAETLGLGQERPAARVPGPFDERRDALVVDVVIDAPASCGDRHDRAPDRLVDDATQRSRASCRLIRAFALAPAVDRAEQISLGHVSRAGLALREPVAEPLLVVRLDQRRGCGHPVGEEVLPVRVDVGEVECRRSVHGLDRSREVARKESRARAEDERVPAEARLLRRLGDLARELRVLDRFLEVAEHDGRRAHHVVGVDELVAVL